MTDSEKDGFWDISDLVPKKKTPYQLPPAFPVRTVTVESGSDTPRKEEETLHFSQGQVTPAEEYVYHPKDHMLLEKVTLRHTEVRYRFYSHFLEDAHRIFPMKGEKCDFVPFFSYLPQYAQLSQAQLAYYLYFRDEVRQGRYPQTSQSYFLLYVFELINLPDVIPPKEGAHQLAAVWAAYRERLPQMDKFMVQWLMDYCLVHEVACPGDVIAPFLRQILGMAKVKEFYLGGVSFESAVWADAIIALCSDYDPGKSRLAQGEHREALLSHLERAVLCVLQAQKEHAPRQGAVRSLQFDAFLGALCTFSARKHITLSYYPVESTESLRRLVTGTVKYTENKLRAHLGMKSRLAVPPLPDEVKQLLDKDWQTAVPTAQKAPPRPEYEALYDAQDMHFSPTEAVELEKDSWQNTRLLVEEDTEEEASDPSFDLPVLPGQQEKVAYGLSPGELLFLTALMRGDTALMQQASAKEKKTPQTMAEHINECMMDGMGDIILEITPEGMTLIPDYQEEVMSLLGLQQDE